MSYRTSGPLDADDTQEAEAREYPLWGTPGAGYSLVREGTYYDSHLVRILRETWRGAAYVVSGAETSGEVDEADGHDHTESPEAAMPWLAVGTWRLSPGGARYQSTSDLPALRAYAVLPAAFDRYRLRLRVYLDSTLAVVDLGLRVRVRVYSPSDLETTPVADFGYMTAYLADKGQELGEEGVGVWLSTGDLDLSAVPLTAGLRIAVLALDVRVSDGAAHADVHEAALVPSPLWAYAAPDEVALDLSHAEAARVLPEAEAMSLLFDGPRNLRARIFGTTGARRTLSVPHDHGEGRGERIPDRALLSVAYGPHLPEGGGGTADGTLGIPLWRTSAGNEITPTTPKLTAWHSCPVPAGVRTVKVRAQVGLAGSGTRTASVIVEVRPREDAGYTTPGAGSGVSVTLSYSVTGSTVYTDASDELDLTPLGALSSDRLFDLVVWQGYEPATVRDDRLLALLVLPETEALTREDDRPGAPPVASLYPAQLRAGSLLTTTLASQAARVVRQVLREAIGGVPGLDADDGEDASDPWRRVLTLASAQGPHQHRGSYVRDGVRVDDGAVIRYPLAVQCYARNVAGGSESVTGVNTREPVRGEKLPGKIFALSGTIPQGLGAVEILALVQPATESPSGRLWMTVDVLPVSVLSSYSLPLSEVYEPSILVDLAAGEGAVASGAGTDGLSILVEPGDSPAIWQPARVRSVRGLGSWTLDAIKREVATGASTTHAARWTQPVTARISPTRTGLHVVTVRLELQTGALAAPGAGTVDSQARCLALVVMPARGF